MEGRYVSGTNRLSRGMHWFKPETAPERSVRSARVSRCSLRAADGARGEAWRPLTVSHGVSETGTIDYHHGVIHPGRGASSGARLGAQLKRYSRIQRVHVSTTRTTSPCGAVRAGARHLGYCVRGLRRVFLRCGPAVVSSVLPVITYLPERRGWVWASHSGTATAPFRLLPRILTLALLLLY